MFLKTNLKMQLTLAYDCTTFCHICQFLSKIGVLLHFYLCNKVPRSHGVGINSHKTTQHYYILQHFICSNYKKVPTLYFSALQVAAKVLILNTGPIYSSDTEIIQRGLRIMV